MLSFDFTGKVALVTGSSGGIGFAIARRLLEAGANVMLNGSREEPLDAAMKALGPLRDRAATFRADVRNSAEVEAMFTALVDRWGRIDILVNNAGGTRGSLAPVAEMTDEQWDFVVGNNLTQVFLCSRAGAQRMISQGGGGIIVNIASGAWKNASAGSGAYCASKAGVVMLTACMAKELGPHKINVNAVAPGLVDVGKPPSTPRVAAGYTAVVNRTPWGRMGKPEEVAAVVMMLCTADAEFVTGAVVGVDGGLDPGR